MAETKYNLPTAETPNDPLVDIATDNTWTNGPRPGDANKIVPPSGLQTEGFYPGEEPAPEHFNYTINNFSGYIDFNQENQVLVYEYRVAGTYLLELPDNVGRVKCIAIGAGGGGGAGGGEAYLPGPSGTPFFGGGGGGGSGRYGEVDLPLYPFDNRQNNKTLEITVGTGGSAGTFTGTPGSVDITLTSGSSGTSSKVAFLNTDTTFQDDILIANGGVGGKAPSSTGGFSDGNGGDGGAGRCGGGGGGAMETDPPGGDGVNGGLGGKYGNSGSDGLSSPSGNTGGTGGSGDGQFDPGVFIGVGGLNFDVGEGSSVGGGGGNGGAGWITSAITAGSSNGSESWRGKPGYGIGAGGAGGGPTLGGVNPGSGGSGANGAVFIIVYPETYIRVTP